MSIRRLPGQRPVRHQKRHGEHNLTYREQKKIWEDNQIRLAVEEQIELAQPGDRLFMWNARAIVIPRREFFYTLDQVESMLQVDHHEFVDRLVRFPDLGQNRALPKRIDCINWEKDPNKPPDWRISETELIRFIQAMGYAHIPCQEEFVRTGGYIPPVKPDA